MNESFTNLTFTKAGVEGVEAATVSSGCQALSFADLSPNVQQNLLVIPNPVLSICQSHCGSCLVFSKRGTTGHGRSNENPQSLKDTVTQTQTRGVIVFCCCWNLGPSQTYQTQAWTRLDLEAFQRHSGIGKF